MNAQRLNNIYSNIRIAEKSDIESIKQLTVDYPFYYLPYVVLAKYYYDTGHYKFEDMLRQAAMRVKDRRELYHYIHGNIAQVESSIDPDNIKYEEPVLNNVVPVTENKMTEPLAPENEIAAQEVKPEGKAGIADFLADFGNEQDKKPQEFVFEGKHRHTDLDDIEMDREPVGEEIGTEFSFSKSFNIIPPEEEKPAETIAEMTETANSETIVHEDLRKSPVYNVETFISEGSIDLQEDLSPEKDFFAWLQHPQYTREVKEEEEAAEEKEKQDHKMDLIEKFINVNPQISRPKKEFYNPENMAKKSEIIDLEYVTETLANIYYEQGNYDLAVKAYKKLSLQNPSKQAFFASLIEKIKKEKKQ